MCFKQHDMRANGGMAPCILNLGTIGKFHIPFRGILGFVGHRTGLYVV